MGIESGIPLDLLMVIVAFVMLFVAAPSVIRSIWRLRPAQASAPPSAEAGVQVRRPKRQDGADRTPKCRPMAMPTGAPSERR
jgi:hypothetical protein